LARSALVESLSFGLNVCLALRAHFTGVDRRNRDPVTMLTL
jgi:hypothetical protein